MFTYIGVAIYLSLIYPPPIVNLSIHTPLRTDKRQGERMCLLILFSQFRLSPAPSLVIVHRDIFFYEITYGEPEKKRTACTEEKKERKRGQWKREWNLHCHSTSVRSLSFLLSFFLSCWLTLSVEVVLRCSMSCSCLSLVCCARTSWFSRSFRRSWRDTRSSSSFWMLHEETAFASSSCFCSWAIKPFLLSTLSTSFCAWWKEGRKERTREKERVRKRKTS